MWFDLSVPSSLCFNTTVAAKNCNLQLEKEMLFHVETRSDTGQKSSPYITKMIRNEETHERTSQRLNDKNLFWIPRFEPLSHLVLKHYSAIWIITLAFKPY